MRRLAAALLLAAAAVTAATPRGPSRRRSRHPRRRAPPGAHPAIFDPAKLEGALLAQADLPGWELQGETGSGITGIFRFCGGSWTGLEAARGPRERIWTDRGGTLLMQDVRVYDRSGSARTALAEFARLASCDDVEPVDVPRLGDGSHAFATDFRDRYVTAAFVIAGRYGTVVVTDEEPPVPLLRKAAGALRRYAARESLAGSGGTSAGGEDSPRHDVADLPRYGAPVGQASPNPPRGTTRGP